MEEERDVENFLRRLTPGRESVIQVAEAVGLDGKKTQGLMFTQRITPKERQESAARDHTFHSVAGLVAYLEKYKTDQTVILADVALEKMTVTLDEEAKKGVETLSFAPQVHPTFAPWRDLLARDEDLPIPEFARFVMANRRVIAKPDGKELAGILAQVRNSIKVVIDRGRGKRAVNGIVVEQKIQGQTASEHVEIPDTLTLLAPLYVDTGERAVTVDIDVFGTGSPEAPVVFVRATSPDLAALRVEVFEAMLETIGKKLPKVVVALGRESRHPWQRVS